MKRFYFFTSVLILQTSLAFASASGVTCSPESYTELLKCIDKGSPEVAIAEQQLKAAGELEARARQWANPDLEIESLAKGSDKSETTATLLFNLRLGGKRSAEVAQAEAETEQAIARRDLSVGNAKLNAMLALYRLAHLKAEIAVVEESGMTFGKIVRQYQKRPALAPEEKVSLSIFKIATADNVLSLNKLKTEQNALLSELSVLSGASTESILKSLPESKTSWPQLAEPEKKAESPQVRSAAAEVKLAESEKSKAEGEAWPDLKIGPTMKVQKDNGVSETFNGISLSMPLPLFSLNGGARAYSTQKLNEAELRYDFEKKKAQSKRLLLVEKYTSLTRLLENSLGVKELESRHEVIEKEFFKGLVSGALVIEAHRQLFEYVEKRNQSELQAIEALGQILIDENRFEGVLL